MWSPSINSEDIVNFASSIGIDGFCCFGKHGKAVVVLQSVIAKLNALRLPSCPPSSSPGFGLSGTCQYVYVCNFKESITNG